MKKMITEKDFDTFLKNGFMDGLTPQTSLEEIIDRYGNDYWTVRETENNGLVYGIVMIGMVELHIYDEKLSGISFRPYAFDKRDYTKKERPWISKKLKLKEILKELNNREIQFQKYSCTGPMEKLKTAGAKLFSLVEGEHTFIDTEGGVTFLFDSIVESPEIETYQICKYFD